MQTGLKFRRILATLGLVSVAAITYTIGYNHGTSVDDAIVDNSPIIAVPSDYLLNANPVPYINNGRFAFDTFLFTDDQGQQMAMPVPAETEEYWAGQMKLIAQQ